MIYIFLLYKTLLISLSPESFLKEKIQTKVPRTETKKSYNGHEKSLPPLEKALKENDFDTFKSLLESGESPDIYTEEEIPLLNYTVFWGHLKYMVCLIQHGASLNLDSNTGSSIKFICEGCGHINDLYLKNSLAHYFFMKGIYFDEKKEAFHTIDLEKAHRIHSNFFNQETQDVRSALIWSITYKQPHLTRLLLSYGQNNFIQTQTYTGDNLLQMTAYSYMHQPKPYQEASEKDPFMLLHHHPMKTRNFIDFLWDFFKEQNLDPFMPNHIGETPEYRKKASQYIYEQIVKEATNREQVEKEVKIEGLLAEESFQSQNEKFKQVLNHITEKSTPLKEALQTLQYYYPLPHNKMIPYSRLFQESLKILEDKISKETLSVKEFFKEWRQLRLPHNMILLEEEISIGGQQHYPYDWLLLCTYGLKDTLIPSVKKWTRQLLVILLKNYYQQMTVHNQRWTKNGQTLIQFFDLKELSEEKITLKYDTMYQELQKDNPIMLTWIFLMNQEEIEQLAQIDFQHLRVCSTYHPFNPFPQIVNLTLATRSTKPWVQSLVTKVKIFNEHIQQRLESEVPHKKIDHLEQLIDFLEKHLPQEEIKKIKKEHPLQKKNWKVHGRSIDVYQQKFILKIKKLNESNEEFTDQEVLQEVQDSSSLTMWGHLKSIQKITLSLSLKKELEEYINTHQEDKNEHFELDTEATLFFSEVPYFIYIDQIEENEKRLKEERDIPSPINTEEVFLNAIENNIRQTVRLYQLGCVRHQVITANHDITSHLLTPESRKRLQMKYDLTTDQISFWKCNIGIMSDRKEALKISNMGLGIRDPGNYIHTKELSDQEIESQIMNALIEVPQVAFDFYIEFYRNKKLDEQFTKKMTQDILDRILRPILEEMMPSIDAPLWTPFLNTFKNQIEQEAQLFTENPNRVDQVIMREKARDAFFQSLMSSVKRIYSLIALYSNQEKELEDLLKQHSDFSKEQPLTPSTSNKEETKEELFKKVKQLTPLTFIETSKNQKLFNSFLTQEIQILDQLFKKLTTIDDFTKFFTLLHQQQRYGDVYDYIMILIFQNKEDIALRILDLNMINYLQFRLIFSFIQMEKKELTCKVLSHIKTIKKKYLLKHLFQKIALTSPKKGNIAFFVPLFIQSILTESETSCTLILAIPWKRLILNQHDNEIELLLNLPLTSKEKEFHIESFLEGTIESLSTKWLKNAKEKGILSQISERKYLHLLFHIPLNHDNKEQLANMIWTLYQERNHFNTKTIWNLSPFKSFYLMEALIKSDSKNTQILELFFEMANDQHKKETLKQAFKVENFETIAYFLSKDYPLNSEQKKVWDNQIKKWIDQNKINTRILIHHNLINRKIKIELTPNHFSEITPLAYAIKEKKERIIEEFLKEGASLQIDTPEYSPLHWAIQSQNKELTFQILNSQEKTFLSEKTIINYPQSHLGTEIFEKLIQESPPIDPSQLVKLFFNILTNGRNNEEIIGHLRVLKENKISIDRLQEYKMFIIRRSLSQSHPEVIYELIENNLKSSSDIAENIYSREENHYHHLANNPYLTEELLEKVEQNFYSESNSINQINRNKKTPLHIAIEQNQLKTVLLFLKRGANILIEDQEENTPIQMLKLKLQQTPNDLQLLSIFQELLQMNPDIELDENELKIIKRFKNLNNILEKSSFTENFKNHILSAS